MEPTDERQAMELNVSLDTSGVNRFLYHFAQKQMPFAAARALTWTAQDCQKEVRRELPRKYTLRNRFVEQGIRIRPAQKDNLESAIYTRADGKYSIDFMVLHDTGGIKRPRGQHLAIPGSSKGLGHVSVRTNSRGIIRRSDRPRQLLQDKQRYFKGTIKGVEGIWKRTGPKKSKGGYPKPHINLMYILESSGNIQRTFDFEPTCINTARQRIDRNFQLSLRDALK